MLTIPETIKTLFKTDGVRKNFRASFPNGEYSDITNANVVRESLHFTESLCSQDPFKFGLAEASVIEFETVGVGNMYGMTIVCSIEIDTSSLSAAQISAIQSDPGDGTLVLAAASDIGYGYYRVPLGTFKVTNCPRNHGAMAHRKVTAYTDYIGGSVEMPPQEVGKLGQQVWSDNSPNYNPNIPRLVFSSLAYRNPSLLSGMSHDNVMAVANFSYVIPGTTWGDYIVRVNVSGKTFTANSGYLDRVHLITLGSTPDYDSAPEWVMELVDTNPGLAVYANEISDYVKRYSYPETYRSGSNSYPVPPVNDQIAWYAYPTDGTHGSSAIRVPSSIKVTVWHDSTVIGEQTFSIVDLSSANGVAIVDSFSNIRASFSPTSSIKNGASLYYKYIDAYDFDALFTGWLEIEGQFCKPGRMGAVVPAALDDTSPVSIAPGNYEECWWDEYDVSPIGTVTVKITDDEGDQAAEISIGEGLSVYDMTDNTAFNYVGGQTLTSIETLLNGDFAAAAAKVGFTPVEMTMQGWPWIEAGDALEITAEDGTVIDTFALRVELSGIQRLSMDVESKAGEIIGEV